jgi:hypothetical protein
MVGLKIFVLLAVLLVSANRIIGGDDRVIDDIRIDENDGRDALDKDTFINQYEQADEWSKKNEDTSADEDENDDKEYDDDDDDRDDDDDEYDEEEDDGELEYEEYEEEIRIQMYKERGYEWPIPEVNIVL